MNGLCEASLSMLYLLLIMDFRGSQTLRVSFIAGCMAWAITVPVIFSAAAPQPDSGRILTSSQCNQFTFDAMDSYVPSGRPVVFHWDFGDGITDIGPVVTHAYKKSGDYTITLSIQDDSGLKQTAPKISHIVRVNLPPEPQLIAPAQGCIHEELTFDARASRDEKVATPNFHWDFGDGTSASGERVVRKIYPKGGSYKVVLTVDDGTDSPCHARSTERIVRINEPPVAQIGRDVFMKCVEKEDDLTVEFDASKSTDGNNDPLTYTWDFDDGTKATGAQVTHRYAKPGHYDVKLIASDETNLGCGLGVSFVTVRLNRAPKAEAGEDVNVCLRDEVVFDGSTSFAERKGTLDTQWAFGDGQNSNRLKTTHRYEQPGVYRASLTVSDQLNAMCPPSNDIKTVTVNAPPQIVAIESVEHACTGDKVQLSAVTNDSDGDDLQYFWNFGDGTVSQEGSRVTHLYAQGGRYRVSLVVDDGKKTKCSSDSATNYIYVNTPPVADAGVNQACCANMEAVFDAGASLDPDNDKLTYHWDFGDGTSAEGAQVRHVYKKSGSFPVTLTVDDHSESACSRSTSGFTATITDSPVPVIRVR